MPTAKTKSAAPAAPAETTAVAAAPSPFEDAVALGRDNLEAMVRSGAILSRGLQDFGRLMLGLAQDTVEQGVGASQQMLAARSVTEVVDLQSSLARSGLDRLLAEGSRLSEVSIRLAEEAFAPIGERVTATLDRLVSAV